MVMPTLRRPGLYTIFTSLPLVFILLLPLSLFFFFNDTATTEIYTLSLHDALPICRCRDRRSTTRRTGRAGTSPRTQARSEEHTSELQSRQYLVCRLLLEKKKNRHEYGL